MQAHYLAAVSPNKAALPWLKLPRTDLKISYGPGFNSISSESFKLLVALTVASIFVRYYTNILLYCILYTFVI